MPGRCKFQDAWLAKEIYKDWLVQDPHDIQLARCRVCCKAIKLQTMGEAALTSHAAGTGHKAAVRKAVEGNMVLMNASDHVNGYGSIKDEDDKEQVALSLHLNSFDRMTGSDPSAALDHGVVSTSSTSHNAPFQEVAFLTSYIDIPNLSSGDCGVPRVPAHNNNNNHHHHPRLLLHPPQQHPHLSPSPARRRHRRKEPGKDAAPPPKPRSAAAAALARRDQAEALEKEKEKEEEKEERVEMLGAEQRQEVGRREQMEDLEWERRMRVLAWEQEVLREKGKAARQKARAYRMKRRYYGAKLRRMGHDAPPSSSSSSSSGEDGWGGCAPAEDAVFMSGGEMN